MRTIQTLVELEENLDTLDTYIQAKREPEYSFALDLVKQGICFVSRKVNGQLRFYPSRFVGYAGNTKNRHEANEYKNGRETNPVISKICGAKYLPNAEMEKAYRAYCGELGFVARERGPFRVEHKFWPTLK